MYNSCYKIRCGVFYFSHDLLLFITLVKAQINKVDVHITHFAMTHILHLFVFL